MTEQYIVVTWNTPGQQPRVVINKFVGSGQITFEQIVRYYEQNTDFKKSRDTLCFVDKPVQLDI